ncbi:MAG: GYF domain-containing protein [Roseovarius sp.]
MTKTDFLRRGRAHLVAVTVGLLLALAGPASIAAAQSASSITVNGVKITISGSGSQSISTTPTGAEIVIDGREIVIDGTKIALDGSSIDSGAFEEVEIAVDGNTIRILVDGREVITSTRSAPAEENGEAELTEAARLNNMGVAYYRGEGVEQSYEKAVEYYEKALALGSTIAADNLSSIYWYGVEGIPVDEPRSVGYARTGFEDDHPHSIYVMGMAYLKGITVEENLTLALDYLNRAGDEGRSDALNQLGVEYARGETVPMDEAKAAEYYLRAAELDNHVAQSNYAWFLWQGRGVEKDAAEALRYALMSVEKGNRAATFLAGVIHYHGGEGVAVDMAEAARMFEAAARDGHVTAAFNLGVMYRNGEGVPEDLDRAIEWMEMALEGGHEDAAAELDRLRARQAEAAATDTPQEPIWWYADGQQQVGPMTLNDLRTAMAAGRVGADTLVWRKGMTDWVVAGSVGDLAQ